MLLCSAADGAGVRVNSECRMASGKPLSKACLISSIVVLHRRWPPDGGEGERLRERRGGQCSELEATSGPLVGFPAIMTRA